VVKLLNYSLQEASLEADSNPFGVVVLTHLQALARRGDPNTRKVWKTRLVKGLFDRGLDAAAIRARPRGRDSDRLAGGDRAGRHLSEQTAPCAVNNG